MTPPLPSTKLALLKSVPLAFLVKFAVTFEEVITNNSSDEKLYIWHGNSSATSSAPLQHYETQCDAFD